MSITEILIEIFQGCSTKEALVEIERFKNYLDKVAIIQSSPEFPELFPEQSK